MKWSICYEHFSGLRSGAHIRLWDWGWRRWNEMRKTWKAWGTPKNGWNSNLLASGSHFVWHCIPIYSTKVAMTGCGESLYWVWIDVTTHFHLSTETSGGHCNSAYPSKIFSHAMWQLKEALLCLPSMTAFGPILKEIIGKMTSKDLLSRNDFSSSYL